MTIWLAKVHIITQTCKFFPKKKHNLLKNICSENYSFPYGNV